MNLSKVELLEIICRQYRFSDEEKTDIVKRLDESLDYSKVLHMASESGLNVVRRGKTYIINQNME